MYPSPQQAESLLCEAAAMNPGPWVQHSRVTADCAKKIAQLCSGMDEEKAYVCGLLHDIGRRFGVTYMRHVIDGYHFLMELGYDETARICLTHSFSIPNIQDYIGKVDVSEEGYLEILQLIASYEYDDYDRLIQLCDSIAMPFGVADLETRMGDVKSRYGRYPQDKWDKHFEHKRYFEQKMGKNLYEVLDADKALWGR